MLTTMMQRVARRSARPSGLRALATTAESTGDALRDIHFVEDDEAEAAAKPFRIVGVRDVEVQDWEYPTRVEAEQKSDRAIRNRFQHPNFISLWVDKLAAVEAYLAAEKVPVATEGIVPGPDGHDVLVIPPSADGSVEFFNLCDNPTLVELVQAPEALVKEFEEEKAFEADLEDLSLLPTDDGKMP